MIIVFLKATFLTYQPAHTNDRKKITFEEQYSLANQSVREIQQL